MLGGTTGIPCNSAADFQRIDVIVPHFEEQTGIDITPCFDGQTGAWDPGPECGGFYTGDHTGTGSSGTWADWCGGELPASGYGAQCGEPFGGGDGDGDPEPTGDGDGDPTSGDGDGDPDPSAGDGDGDPATGDGDGEGESDGAEGSDSGDEDGPDTFGESGDDATGSPVSEEGGEGCSCSSEAPTKGGWLALLLLFGLASLRRRRD